MKNKLTKPESKALEEKRKRIVMFLYERYLCRMTPYEALIAAKKDSKYVK